MHSRFHMRILAGLLAACLLVGTAAAQQPAPAGDLSPQQAAQALSVLRDDAKRAEMIGVLEAIAKTAPAAVTGPLNPPAPPATAPAATAVVPPAQTVRPAAATSGGVAIGAAPAASGGVVASGTVLAPGTVLGPGTVLAPGVVVASEPPAAGQSAAAPAAATGIAGLAAAATAGAAPGKLVNPLAPNGLGAQVLVRVAGWLRNASDSVADTTRSLTNFTLLVRWARDLAKDPDSRAEILDAGWKLLVVAASALGAEFLLRRAVRRPRTRLLQTTMPLDPPSRGATLLEHRRYRRARTLLLLRRLPVMLGRVGLDAGPVIIGGLAGYVLLSTRLGEPNTTRLVILALLGAYVACRIATAVTAAVVSPEAAGLRLIGMDDDTAASVVRWVRRLSVVSLYGYAVTEVLLLFGLYRVAHDTLLKLVALSVHLMLVVLVLRHRKGVAKVIRAPDDRHGLVSWLRNGFAPLWHFVVIFYLIALWGVWALDVPGGYTRLVRIFVTSVVVINVARVITWLLVAGIDHAFATDAPVTGRSASMDAAIRRYVPAVRVTAEVLIGIAAGILLLEGWGLDSLSWFASDALGGRLLSALLTSLMTIVVALLIWEVSNAGVQTHLARLTREGHAARSARLRTLLPMLRTALAASIFLVAGLTVLSELGFNIAPLLAGAGVIGLAIGFGSQKLVQDIITGLFLLLENTMQVGDVVTLGGLTGTVENLSIRTIRLRAIDGSVHIVPFSAVTTVTNMTRDFAYALLDISVGLNEEPDHISDIVRDLVDEMRGEPRWGAAITDQIEIMGLEKFIDTAWVLRCRLRTVPSQRWVVARELNRRLKYRFDELAIESPFTSYRVLSAPPPAPPNAKTALDEAA